MSRAEHPTTTRRSVLSRVVPAVLGLGLAATLAACGAGQITQTDTQEPAVNGASGNVGPIALRDVQLAAPSDRQSTYQPGATVRLIITIVNTGQTDDTLTKITTPAASQVLIDGSANGSKVIPSGFSVSSGVDLDDESVTATPGSGLSTPSAPATSVQPGGGVSVTQTPTSQPTSPATGTTGVIPSSPPSTPNGSVPPTGPSSTKPRLPGEVTIDLVGLRSVNGQPLRAGLTVPMTFYFQRAGHVTIGQVPVGAPPDSSAGAANG